MIPKDKEDESRIARHRQEREGCGFETIEAGRDIIEAVEKCDRKGIFLLDSVTALLANEMFSQNDVETPADPIKPAYYINTDAHIKVATDLKDILSKLSNIVIVSDFIYSDAFHYDDLTEAYRHGLAYIDRQAAGLCDVVLEICNGNRITHKGMELINEID